MKRYFAIIIFFVASPWAQAQQLAEATPEGKCAHAWPATPKALDHLYDWQSKYLDDYDVTFYFLDLEVSNSSTFVSGNVTIEAVATTGMDTLAFELIGAHTIDSIIFNKQYRL